MEAGNPDFDAMTKLEYTMKNKLDQIGTTLKEFLLKKLHENNKEIEEMMNIVMALNKTDAESCNIHNHLVMGRLYTFLGQILISAQS